MNKTKFGEEFKKLILVADDEMINREILGAVLEDDYEVIFACDGAEALDVIEKKGAALSLVLLDLIMPGTDGFEVIKKVKASPELSRIPIIVLTSERSAEVKSLSLGAIDFISKPYPQPEIIKARVLRTIELSEDRETIRYTERDGVTGLYNKDYFFRYATQHDHHHADEAMDALYIDVNRFHLVNERYGRAFGDRLLKKIAEKIKDAVYPLGGIVCRKENDSFIVYVPHLDSCDFIAERASVGLESDGKSLGKVHVRVGVYENVDKSIEVERRFDRAKRAADSIRNSYNTSCAFYDDSLHQSKLFAEQLIEDFRQAIDERQFTVFFQPKFDIRPDTPVLASAEALIRWKHPKHGMISPGVFIPLFEENGLIKDLDSYVWRRSAEKIAEWKKKYGISVPVSVNVSRVDMLYPDLIDTLCAILTDNDLSPEEMYLEITESAYTNDSDQIIETVKKLRQIGFKIEMDDFGTGYSSLNMISKLPIDALKLDMQFIRTAFNERHDTRMLEVIIEIADYLGVPVIAEGVETEEQLRALRIMGCDLVQGYYFSKPLPAEEYERFIAEKSEHAGESTAVIDEQVDASLNDPATKSLAFGKIEHALTGIFEVIYYVNTQNDHYYGFHSIGRFKDLQLGLSGADFFADSVKGVQDVVYAPDLDLVVRSLNKKYLLGHLTGEAPFSLTYRLMIDGVPTYYNMKAVRALNDRHHIVVAIKPVVDIAAKAVDDTDRSDGDSEFMTAARALSGIFEVIYYVNLETDEYTEFTSRGTYDTLDLHLSGKNFFDECRKNVAEVVAPGDHARVLDALDRDFLVRTLAESGTVSVDYHLLIGGEPTPYRMKIAMSDRKHIIIGVSGIADEVKERSELSRAISDSVTYSSIAAALAADYFGIYYVDTVTGEYSAFRAPDEFADLGIEEDGDDFFKSCAENIPKAIHKDDVDAVRRALKKHNLLRALDKNGTFTMKYRLMVDGKPVFVSLKATRMEAENGRYIVVGVNSIDAQIKKEKELNAAKEAVNLDVLTGVKSKKAFTDSERVFDGKIKRREELAFSVVVCDLNGLKTVNDSLGHVAGDNYIKEASSVICNVFKHSPVYRVGGDEFAAVLTGPDYENRDGLFKALCEQCSSADPTRGVSAACGIADFDPARDASMQSVFERADALMYENKTKMKAKR